MKKKNIYFITFILVFICSIISLNYFVDPYNLFFKKIPMINVCALPRELFYISLKAYKSLKSDTLVIGSSESVGLFYTGHFQPYFNLVAIAGLDYSQYYEILNNYLKLHPETKNVYIFLNYICLFQDKLLISELPPFGSKNFTISELVRVLFSFESTIKSINILAKQLIRKSNSYNSEGSYLSVFYKQIDLINEKIIKNDYHNLNRRNINSIKQIIELLKEKNISYTFVFPPYSAVYLSVIDEYNQLQSQVENFKRELVRLSSNSVKIYDFSFVNKYSSLPFHHGNDVYYYNCSHPNSFWGAKVYRILFDNVNLRDDDKDLFFILYKENIENVLNIQKKLLSEYKNKNVDIVNMYKKIARTSYSDDRSSRNIYFENYSEDMIRENEYLNDLFFKSTLKNKAEI